MPPLTLASRLAVTAQFDTSVPRKRTEPVISEGHRLLVFVVPESPPVTTIHGWLAVAVHATLAVTAILRPVAAVAETLVLAGLISKAGATTHSAVGRPAHGSGTGGQPVASVKW